MQEGSQAIIDTLIKGLEKHGGSLSVKTRARRVLRASASETSGQQDVSSGADGVAGILRGFKNIWRNVTGGSGGAVNEVEPLDTAVGVELVGPDGCPKVVRVRQAVISNASVWDTERILTTTGDVGRDWASSQQAQRVDKRVLQEAAAVSTGQLVGQSGSQVAAELPAISGSVRVATTGSQTAMLDRPNGAARLSPDLGGSFDTQSMRNPLVESGGTPGEGVMDSMGSIDSDDWSANSCEWEAPVGQDGKWLREDFLDYVNNLEMNASMMHLHVGFEAREGVCGCYCCCGSACAEDLYFGPCVLLDAPGTILGVASEQCAFFSVAVGSVYSPNQSMHTCCVYYIDYHR